VQDTQKVIYLRSGVAGGAFKNCIKFLHLKSMTTHFDVLSNAKA
jgi:hypothetical protein